MRLWSRDYHLTVPISRFNTYAILATVETARRQIRPHTHLQKMLVRVRDCQKVMTRSAPIRKLLPQSWRHSTLIYLFSSTDSPSYQDNVLTVLKLCNLNVHCKSSHIWLLHSSCFCWLVLCQCTGLRWLAGTLHWCEFSRKFRIFESLIKALTYANLS